MVTVVAKESAASGPVGSMYSRTSTIMTDNQSEDRPEEMTNEGLFTAVKKLKTMNRELFLENEIFENYIKRSEPALLIGFDKLLQQAAAAATAQIRAQAITAVMIQPMNSNISLSFSGTNLSGRRGTDESIHGRVMSGVKAVHSTYSAMKFGSSTFGKLGPKIITTHKIDMVIREMEELRTMLEEMHESSRRKRANLRAQIEQYGIMIQEVEESEEELIANVIIGAYDNITQRIPAEKFIRHMENWFKQADSMVGKFRLKTSTLRALNIRLQTQLQQKLELGESLHPVDFDQLRIENTEFLHKLDGRNRHLIELKRMAGKSNVAVTNFKDRLFKECKKLKGFQKSIVKKENRISALSEETELAEIEVEKAERALYRIKRIRETYYVPEVIEYVKQRRELISLKKELKIWVRKYQVQHGSLVSSMSTLQKVNALAAAVVMNTLARKKLAHVFLTPINEKAHVNRKILNKDPFILLPTILDLESLPSIGSQVVKLPAI